MDEHRIPQQFMPGVPDHARRQIVGAPRPPDAWKSTRPLPDHLYGSLALSMFELFWEEWIALGREEVVYESFTHWRRWSRAKARWSERYGIYSYMDPERKSFVWVLLDTDVLPHPDTRKLRINESDVLPSLDCEARSFPTAALLFMMTGNMLLLGPIRRQELLDASIDMRGMRYVLGWLEHIEMLWGDIPDFSGEEIIRLRELHWPQLCASKPQLGPIREGIQCCLDGGYVEDALARAVRVVGKRTAFYRMPFQEPTPFDMIELRTT